MKADAHLVFTLSEIMTNNMPTPWINTSFWGKQSVAGCMLAHRAVRQQGCVAGGRPACQLTSVFKVVLAYTLGRQFCQHIVQVVGVRVAMAGQIGTKLCLVVDLVPHHRVRLARGARRADGEDEAPVPGHDQELEDLQGRTRDNQGDFDSTLSSIQRE